MESVKKRKGRRRLGGNGRALGECVQLRRSADHDRAHAESGAVHYGRHSEWASEWRSKRENERGRLATLDGEARLQSPRRTAMIHGLCVVPGDNNPDVLRMRRVFPREDARKCSTRTPVIGASLFLPFDRFAGESRRPRREIARD